MKLSPRMPCKWKSFASFSVPLLFTEKKMPGRCTTFWKSVAEHEIRGDKSLLFREMLCLHFRLHDLRPLLQAFGLAAVQGMYTAGWFVLILQIHSGGTKVKVSAEPAPQTLWTPVPASFLPSVARSSLQQVCSPEQSAVAWPPCSLLRHSGDLYKGAAAVSPVMWYNAP